MSQIETSHFTVHGILSSVFGATGNNNLLSLEALCRQLMALPALLDKIYDLDKSPEGDEYSQLKRWIDNEIIHELCKPSFTYKPKNHDQWLETDRVFLIDLFLRLPKPAELTHTLLNNLNPGHMAVAMLQASSIMGAGQSIDNQANIKLREARDRTPQLEAPSIIFDIAEQSNLLFLSAYDSAVADFYLYWMEVSGYTPSVEIVKNFTISHIDNNHLDRILDICQERLSEDDFNEMIIEFMNRILNHALNIVPESSINYREAARTYAIDQASPDDTPQWLMAQFHHLSGRLSQIGDRYKKLPVDHDDLDLSTPYNLKSDRSGFSIDNVDMAMFIASQSLLDGAMFKFDDDIDQYVLRSQNVGEAHYQKYQSELVSRYLTPNGLSAFTFPLIDPPEAMAIDTLTTALSDEEEANYKQRLFMIETQDKFMYEFDRKTEAQNSDHDSSSHQSFTI